MEYKHVLNLIRPLNGFSENAKIVHQFTNDRPLKADVSYTAGKMGNVDEALELVCRLVSEASIESAGIAFVGQADYLLPIYAAELQGDNAIPLALAALYSVELDIEMSAAIQQSNKAYHTGADPMERLISRATFVGLVERGKRYLLVDDVSTMGSTLADCAAYIATKGGMVVGAIVLTNSSRSGQLKARKKDLKIIEERYDETVRELFSIAPNALTYDEAFYIAGFRDANALRTRAVKARIERENRISSKKTANP